MTHTVAQRPWLSPAAQSRVTSISSANTGLSPAALQAEIERLAAENHQIHDVDCVNLNPATNVMNPRAEAVLAAGLGSRPSLGYPGDKYEMGLEAIEQIEVIAADLACRVFGASYAEVRVGSGALANLYAFMATCRARRHDHRAAGRPSAATSPITPPGAAGSTASTTLPAPVDAAATPSTSTALRDARRTRCGRS